MSAKTITITKVDETAKKPTFEEKTPEVKLAMPKKGGKTMKTFPRGVLKTMKQHKPAIKGVSNPSKPPTMRRDMQKHTIRLITDKGVRRHRKTLRKQISKMSNEKVKELVTKHGLLKNPNTPPSVMREMLEGGAIAGFVSLN
jgi:hypothetical protein